MTFAPASINNLLASLLADVHFALANFVEVVGVLHEDLNSHLESKLVQVEVDAGDLAVGQNLRHSLGGSSGFNSISIYKSRFFG